MLSIVPLHSTPLDSAAPGYSPIVALLFLLMIIAIPMIPYLFLYLFLGDQSGSGEPVPQSRASFSQWLHAHHWQLLHLHH